ncbi:MAG: hypothetical protein ABSA83_11500 [Verrucomicrobiota bacterium]
MKRIKNPLLSCLLLALGWTAPTACGQTFTFTTIAGGTQGSSDGVNIGAQFSTPAGVAVGSNDTVYIADQNNNAIREVAPFGTNWYVITIAGGTEGSADGTNSTAQFSGPSGVAMDSASNLYVADQLNYTIRKIAPSGSNWVVTTIAGQAGVHGLRDGTNKEALFYNPAGIAVDSSGNLFVADEFNNAIRKIAPEGSNWVVTTIAGGTQGSANSTNTAAQFYFPSGVAVDSSDNVYVADQFNNMIRLVAPQGPDWVVTTIAGQLDAGAENAAGTNAQFYQPVSVAQGTNGGLVYVADLINEAIRQLTNSSGTWTVSTVGGGTRGYANGTGTNAQFYFPNGVAADAYGAIFVADSRNNAIRMGIPSESVSPTGNVEVTLTPSAAVTAGAVWQMDGGAWQQGGTTLTNLTPGDHILALTNLAGYTLPSTQPVTVTANQTALVTINYSTAIANAGSLEVLINPDLAVYYGAQWQVDGGALQAGAAVVDGLSVGSHTVTFTTIPDWATPVDQTVAITNGETTLAIGSYIPGIVTNYTMTVSAYPRQGGTVAGSGTFQAGSTDAATATPTGGFEFIGWAGEGTGTNNPLMVTLTTNLNLVAYFAPVGSLTLYLITNGEGTVSPSLNNATLKAGRRYSLRGGAKSTNVFSGWTGTITTNTNPLGFKAETSLVVQANFIPNPFLPLKGIYNGLFASSNGVTEQTAGMLKGLNIAQRGAYSGSLLINGGSHGISGTFSLNGQATNKISRTASQGGPLIVELTAINSTNPAPEVIGTISGTNNGVAWVASLMADFSTKAGSEAAARYTMLIPPSFGGSPPTSSPGGAGYASIATSAGMVTVSGSLADGTAFSESVPATETSYIPVYANLYGGRGLLLGWITLSSTNTSGMSLAWIHPPRATGLYQGGFTNVLSANQLAVSPWTHSATSIQLLTNLSVVDWVYETNSSNFTDYPVNTTASGKITGTTLSGSINQRTGTFRVTVGSGSSKIIGTGVVLLNSTNGGGYYLTETNSQAIELTP